MTDSTDALKTGFIIGVCIVLPWLTNNIMCVRAVRELHGVFCPSPHVDGVFAVAAM